MQIGAIAKKIGLSVDAIRFYERNYLLPRPQEDGKAKVCLRRLERMATGVTGEKLATGAAVC